VLPFVSNDVIRLKDRLILYFSASCLSSVPDRSTRLHIKPSLHWAWLHHPVYVRQYTGILASRFIRIAFTTSSFSFQSMSSPRNPLRRHIPHTNVYYQVIYALYA
jgi:hypothetical protein